MASEPDSIRTRETLLKRLQEDDSRGWYEFYRIYGRIVRDFAINAGLTDTEADEVVQETAIATSRHLPEFKYDPKICRFKSWLLNQASWRVKDQLRKRHRLEWFTQPGRHPSPSNGDSRTATIERVPDPASLELDTLFETKWRKSVLAAALDALKPKFSLKQLQIYDFHAVQCWPASDVAKALGVSVANVYVTKHRVAAALKKETRRLNALLEREIIARTTQFR